MSKFTHPNEAKPGHKWQTRDGCKVEIYRKDDGTGGILGAVYYEHKKKWEIRIWFENGGWFLKRGCQQDLVDVPVKHTSWINVYGHRSTHWSYKTKEAADKGAGYDRIACIKVEYEEGEGL